MCLRWGRTGSLITKPYFVLKYLSISHLFRCFCIFISVLYKLKLRTSLCRLFADYTTNNHATLENGPHKLSCVHLKLSRVYLSCLVCILSCLMFILSCLVCKLSCCILNCLCVSKLSCVYLKLSCVYLKLFCVFLKLYFVYLSFLVCIEVVLCV